MPKLKAFDPACANVRARSWLQHVTPPQVVQAPVIVLLLLGRLVENATGRVPEADLKLHACFLFVDYCTYNGRQAIDSPVVPTRTCPVLEHMEAVCVPANNCPLFNS